MTSKFFFFLFNILMCLLLCYLYIKNPVSIANDFYNAFAYNKGPENAKYVSGSNTIKTF